MSDLPIIPCYNSGTCGDYYNCGNTNCPQTEIQKPCYQNINNETVDTGLVQGICFGNDSDYCNGVMSCCDGEYSCRDGSRNPALNTFNSPMGCDIETHVNPSSCPIDSDRSDCLEFVRTIDAEANCVESCWVSGGNDIVDMECRDKFKTETDCNAMRYFCKWSSDTQSCGVISDDTTPREIYENNTQENPPRESKTFIVKQDCGELNYNTCVEVPTIPTNENWTLTCSRSAWDSTKQTSLDLDTQICCLQKCPDCAKQCITTPRCRYVENACDCCSRDTAQGGQQFMCAKNLFRNVYLEGQDAVIYQGSGYCTWCDGNCSDKTWEVPQVEKDIFEEDARSRDPAAWSEVDGVCNNRCTNYNNCEAPRGEELWNQCIWDESGNTLGVDPQQLVGLPDAEKRKLLSQQGFCLTQSDPPTSQEIKNNALRDICTEKLSYLGSFNGGRVFSPNEEVVACQYRYNWNHNCLPESGNGEPQIAENYLCTWCEDLQCKQGSRDEICSEVIISPFDNQEYCTTNSDWGEQKDGWPRNCGCYFDKLGYEVPVEIIVGVVVGSTFIGILVMVLVLIL